VDLASTPESVEEARTSSGAASLEMSVGWGLCSQQALIPRQQEVGMFEKQVARGMALLDEYCGTKA